MSRVRQIKTTFTSGEVSRRLLGRGDLRAYENGALTGVKRFTGLFTLVHSSPRDAETLRANPLGLYIHSLNWGEDLVTGDDP